MSDLKGVQNELLNDMTLNNIPAKIIDSYPSYYGFKGGLLIPLQEQESYTISAGGIAEYTSTGGRIHYQDYSGEIRADQIVEAWSLGGMIEYKIHYSEVFDLLLQGSTQYFFSSLKYTLILQVGNNNDTEKPQFHSSSFGIEPCIIPTVKYYGFQLGLSLSYLFFIPTNLEYDQVSNAYLLNKHGDKVNIDWSGFRIGVLISYSLKKE
jgi:hypothetical protein